MKLGEEVLKRVLGEDWEMKMGLKGGLRALEKTVHGRQPVVEVMQAKIKRGNEEDGDDLVDEPQQALKENA